MNSSDDSVFTVEKDATDRDLVQIWSSDDMHLLATVLTAPCYRLESTTKTVMTFGEQPGYAPKAIKTWFFPGDLIGKEFLYVNDNH